MAESERVRFDRGSQHRRMPGRRHSPELSIRRSKTQRLARSRFHLERFLPDEILRADRASQATVRRAILQLIQPSEFWASEHGARRDSGEARDADRVWRAYIHHFAAHRTAWRGSRGGTPPAYDRVSITHRFLRRRSN